MDVFISILIGLVIIGVVLWLIETNIPMAAPIKTIFRVVAIIAVIVWIVQKTGAMKYIS